MHFSEGSKHSVTLLDIFKRGHDPLDLPLIYAPCSQPQYQIILLGNRGTCEQHAQSYYIMHELTTQLQVGQLNHYTMKHNIIQQNDTLTTKYWQNTKLNITITTSNDASKNVKSLKHVNIGCH